MRQKLISAIGACTAFFSAAPGLTQTTAPARCSDTALYKRAVASSPTQYKITSRAVDSTSGGTASGEIRGFRASFAYSIRNIGNVRQRVRLEITDYELTSSLRHRTAFATVPPFASGSWNPFPAAVGAWMTKVNLPVTSVSSTYRTHSLNPGEAIKGSLGVACHLSATWNQCDTPISGVANQPVTYAPGNSDVQWAALSHSATVSICAQEALGALHGSYTIEITPVTVEPANVDLLQDEAGAQDKYFNADRPF